MDFVTFSWIDYTLFALIFSLSCAVGFYFGCFRKQQTTADYLLGGKKMKIFPVSMSLIASTLSGVAILGIPTEIYMHGTQYWMIIIPMSLVGVINVYIYLPVFHKLQLTTAFEYFRLRFNKNVKLMASFLYASSCLLCLPLFIYAPALALNQVTGFELYITAPVMCFVCIFYTTIGGLKAIVWTDTLQISVTICTLTFILVRGTISIGGMEYIWEKAKLGDRLEFFDMNPDPTIRTTFCSILFGNIFVFGSMFVTDPAAIQRSIAVPTLKDAQKCTLIYVILSIIIKFLSCFFGLIMYAKYYDCDPISAGFIKRLDQIMPYYVMEEAKAIPGLSGIFIAGLFSTALSTLSTYLNTLSGIFYTDFIAPCLPANTSEKKASTIMKILTVILGFVSIGLVFVMDRLGSILEILLTFRGMTAGPILGLFTMGIMFPFANHKGALCGSIASLLITGWIVIKNQLLRWNGTIRIISKPLYTYGCNNMSLPSVLNYTYTVTEEPSNECPPEEPFWVYRISVHYYFLMSAVLTLIIGIPISWIASSIKDLPVDPNHLSPFVHRYLNTSRATIRYKSIDKELQEFAVKKNNTELDETAIDNLLDKK